jgi:hypothetical protein
MIMGWPAREGGAKVLVVTRYPVDAASQVVFHEDASAALTTLSRCPGYVRGWLGRATDDPGLWLLSTEWLNVGAYRRALSRYDVRVGVVPLLARAIDEPTEFEVLGAVDSEGGVTASGTALAADAGTVGLGRAAAPEVPTDL